jgi:PAS domain S-box-containing protein
LSIDKEVERILVNRFVPASIVVNDQMEIVQFRGRTGAYLEPASGHPTFSLSKMAREGLLVDLRAAINKAKKTNTMVRVERVPVKSNGHSREVDVEVMPVRGQGSSERFYVVVFQDSRKGAPEKPDRGKPKTARDSSVAPRENERLKREVGQLREQLETLIEDHETTSEEFKSANEEVLSANEELQSTNEELETAKEELQSSNEELTTLNEELQNRNTELSLANNDLMNLLGNVNIPVVMVANDLRIRRFTPPAQKLLNLIPADIGRRLHEIRPNLDVDDIETHVQQTIETATLHEREVHEKNGSWYLMRVRPYKTWDNKIDGAVISFQDIDDLKRSVSESRLVAETVIEHAREAIVILDSNLRVSNANRAFYNSFQLKPPDVEGHGIHEIANGKWILPGLREQLQQILRNDHRMDDFEVRHEYPGMGVRTMIFNARRIEPSRGQQMALLSIEDVSDQKRYMEDLQTYSALLELASDAVLVRDLPGVIQLWNHGAEQMYGWNKSETVGKIVHDLLKSKFPVPLKDIMAEVMRRGHWEGELVHTRKDGEQRVVESRWSFRKEGDHPTILELNTDITERKRAEDLLRKLSAQLMQAQDDERRRIARDLHDSTGQKLIALKMSLEQNVSKSDSRDEQVKLAEEVLKEIRTVAQLLHPPLLEEAGLLSAIRWLADGFSSRSGINIHVKANDGVVRLPANLEIALFRVTQEALNNIHRHSGASAATIEVGHRNSSVFLTISDNGHGIESGPARDTVLGVGLLGMRERLAQLGGSLNIRSASTGTTIKAEVPFHEQGSES